jgi:hypothetical protein
MTTRFERPSPERVAALRAEAERRLSPAEFEAYVNAPMSEAEREEIRSLVAWFTRRYPTALERLAYARRAYARWVRGRPPAAS